MPKAAFIAKLAAQELAAAKKVKMSYASNMAALTMLRYSIAKDPSYSFLKIPEVAAPLDHAVQQLEQAIDDEVFIRDAILAKDIGTLRNSYGVPAFVSGLQRLGDEFGKKVQQVEAQINAALQQQKARAAALG